MECQQGFERCSCVEIKLLHTSSPNQWLYIIVQNKEQDFFFQTLVTPWKFNIAPEKWWLEDDPFLLGPGNFSGAVPVKLRGCTSLSQMVSNG